MAVRGGISFEIGRIAVAAGKSGHVVGKLIVHGEEVTDLEALKKHAGTGEVISANPRIYGEEAEVKTMIMLGYHAKY